jgi:hypothetical protein
MITKFNKLYESPDRIYYGKKILNFNTYNAIPFGFIKKYIFDKIDMSKLRKEPDGKLKDNFILGKEYTTHPYIANDYRLYDLEVDVVAVADVITYFDYAGRIWVEDKIMSFWQYPETKEKLKEIINYINELSTDFKIDNNWKIEVYTGDMNDLKQGKWLFNIKQDKDENVTSNNSKIIPIEQYKGSEDPPEQELIIHTLNWREREILKNQGKINMRGWGSDKKAKSNPLWWEQTKRSSESVAYKNKMVKIAEEELDKSTGGDKYFDKIDAALKLPKNLDIIKSIFLQIQKEQGTHFNLILTGGFGDWIMSLIKKGVLDVPGNLVSTNGSLRAGNDKIGKISKGKDVDVVHKKNDIDNQKFIMFDDSYYSGSTKKALEDYLKKYNSEIYKTYVLYDGNTEVDDNRKSLYRYYDYHTGTGKKLGIDILIDYLYSLKLDIPKDIIRDKILKGTITTIREIREHANIYLQKFGKQPLGNLTHKETNQIIRTYEALETESELIFIEGETIDL